MSVDASRGSARRLGRRLAAVLTRLAARTGATGIAERDELLRRRRSTAWPPSAAAGARPPRRRREDDEREHERRRRSSASAGRSCAAARATRGRSAPPRRRDPLVVLVDVERPVQAEELGVRPQEALRVRIAAGELVPALLLERGQVALAEPQRLLDVLESRGRGSRALHEGWHRSRTLRRLLGPVEKASLCVDRHRESRWRSRRSRGKEKAPFMGALRWSRGGSNP